MLQCPSSLHEAAARQCSSEPGRHDDEPGRCSAATTRLEHDLGRGAGIHFCSTMAPVFFVLVPVANLVGVRVNVLPLTQYEYSAPFEVVRTWPATV
jgi:hypothetical protein